MRKADACDKCGLDYASTKQVQVRIVYGIHRGDKSVFSKQAQRWCGRCRAVHDGKWRYARKT